MTKQMPQPQEFPCYRRPRRLVDDDAVAGSRRRRTGGGCWALEAKGVKFKRAQDGTVEELHVGPDALLTLEDYRVLGRYRETLRRVSLSRRSLR